MTQTRSETQQKPLSIPGEAYLPFVHFFPVLGVLRKKGDYFVLSAKLPPEKGQRSFLVITDVMIRENHLKKYGKII